MPARDIYHGAVRAALEKDGWVITHDPLRLSWGTRDLYVDLGAERLIAAERAGQHIAVEVKSFVGASDIADLESALGQYVVYQAVLTETDPERVLYLAVPERARVAIFDEPLGQLLIERYDLRLVVFDPTDQEILRWNP